MQQYVFGAASGRLTHLADRERRSGRLFIYLFFKQQNKPPENVVVIVASNRTTGNICNSSESNPRVFLCSRRNAKELSSFYVLFFCKRLGGVPKSDFRGTVPSAGFIFLSWTNTAPNR